MNPPTTLTNHHPPATIGCGLNPNPIRREESDTPHDGGGQRLGSRMPLCPCCVDVGAEVSELVQDVVVAAF